MAVALDPEIRRQLAKQGRLWLLALLCAAAATFALVRTDSLSAGIGVFLLALLVLGSLLYVYEKRQK